MNLLTAQFLLKSGPQTIDFHPKCDHFSLFLEQKSG